MDQVLDRPTCPALTDTARMRADLERAWAAQNSLPADASDAEDKAANDAVLAVAERIITAPARTLEDYRLKAKAVSWCFNGEPLNLDGREPEDYAATAVRFSESILTELMDGVWCSGGDGRLEHLIQVASTARTKFEETSKRLDILPPLTPKQSADFETASDASTNAFRAILDHRPASLQELAEKTRAVCAGDCEAREREALHALGRDAEALIGPCASAAWPDRLGSNQEGPWAVAVANYKAAKTASDDAVEDDNPAHDQSLAAYSAMRAATPPDLAALIEKARLLIKLESYARESFDDILLRLYFETTESNIMVTLYQDLETLARRSGLVLECQPRSLSARLADMGLEVGPDGLGEGKGVTGAGLQILETLQEGDLELLIASEWIDAFVEADGYIMRFGLVDDVCFTAACPPSKAICELFNLTDETRCAPGARGAITKLAARQMAERGTREIRREPDEGGVA